MIKLPPIEDAVKLRPGESDGPSNIYVPAIEKEELWSAIYEHASDNYKMQWPVIGSGVDKIDELFGFFGFRYQPSTKKAGSFHLGVDISSSPKDKVVACMDGVLEYSGFDIHNGLYVMLSHPEIVSSDGFVMHSLYMRMRDVEVGFTTYQKMLREISMHSYPVVPVERSTTLGHVGNTGLELVHNHLHFQVEFRHKKKNKIVAVDPVRMFGRPVFKNISAKTKNIEDFFRLEVDQKDIVKKNKLDIYFN